MEREEEEDGEKPFNLNNGRVLETFEGEGVFWEKGEEQITLGWRKRVKKKEEAMSLDYF